MSQSSRGHGRIAAIDYGTHRLGIAVTDVQRTLASPYATYTRRSERQDADYLRKFVLAEQVVGFVVGLPVHLDGRESRLSQAARDFGQWLAEQTACPVVYFDERFSTVEAENQLRSARLSPQQRKERRDMLAAQILLSAYLEAGCPEGRTEPKGLDE